MLYLSEKKCAMALMTALRLHQFQFHHRRPPLVAVDPASTISLSSRVIARQHRLGVPQTPHYTIAELNGGEKG